MTQPRRPMPRWLAPLLVGVVGFAVVHPFDAECRASFARFAGWLSGDLRREAQAWQQYGQGMFIIVLAFVVWLLDPARRRRLLDLGLALAIAQVVSTGGKLLIGRPRPREYFNDPWTFLTPWGEYPIKIDGQYRLVRAWDIHAGANTDLWSMPSSHTLFAAVVSVFIATLYPRLRWLVLALVLVVGSGRIMFDAHWPTDVIVGGAAGWLIGRCVVSPYAGVRGLDWLWKRLVNSSATPAYPALAAADRARQGED